MIFKAVGEGRPYPDPGMTLRDWGALPPTQVQLDELITTKRTLDLDVLLAEDSTFYGDMFAHVVQWRGDLYLEDGLHRALRCALAQRKVLHARVLRLPDQVAGHGASGGVLNDHRGEMRFSSNGTGSRLHYVISFEPKVPMTGTLLKRRIESTIRKGLHDVDAKA